ncbi:hypothetical protein CANARDRAFT_111752 [[Candida] arabinofermentans NRRL YB-2248]|uniref:Uncharacterized protein n=1 Tax=[Candida] arabinofermentans NRRL YB-2248 TaxID=983967 RepID=A0A1E4T485_9ASCO|nr:hypothetical protein CANARDRAFT_111752 [[Candida] arabinofermentans NRRL YB-2248]
MDNENMDIISRSRPGSFRSQKTALLDYQQKFHEYKAHKSLKQPKLTLTPTANLVMTQRDMNRSVEFSHLSDSSYVLGDSPADFSDSEASVRGREQQSRLSSIIPREQASELIEGCCSSDGGVPERDSANFHGGISDNLEGLKTITATSEDVALNLALMEANSPPGHQVTVEPEQFPSSSEEDIVMSISEGPSIICNVDIRAQGEPLLPDDSPLILCGIVKSISSASPFCNVLEFKPSCPTHESLLLTILEHEMSHLSLTEKEGPDKHTDYIEKHEIQKNDLKVSISKYLSRLWYRFTHLGDMSPEEYFETYVWERFYDPWFYESLTNPIKGEEFNFDMVPVNSTLDPFVQDTW